MRVFWLVALLSLLSVACQAQMVNGKREIKRPDRAITVTYLASLVGVAFCRDEGSVGFVRVGLSDIERADVEAHEAKHMEQCRRYKTANDFYRWYNTPKGVLESEAEAYMAGWCVSVKHGRDGLSLFQDYASRLTRTLGGEVNRLQVVIEMNKHTGCP